MQMGSQKIFTLKMLLLIVVSVTMLSSIYFVFNSAIKEWDESRNGVNAYEMMFNKNYLTLYFEKSIDTWNAKPPLFTWFVLDTYIAYRKISFEKECYQNEKDDKYLIYRVPYNYIKKSSGRTLKKKGSTKKNLPPLTKLCN
jgi:hypothetical protein